MAEEEDQEKLRESLRALVNDEEVIGRIHTDFADAKEDVKWRDAIKGESSKSGLFVIRADKFGQSGSVMAELPVEAETGEIKAALLKAKEHL